MNCPECWSGLLEYREHTWTEPHGEPCYETWFRCLECGGDFEDSELVHFIEAPRLADVLAGEADLADYLPTAEPKTAGDEAQPREVRVRDDLLASRAYL
jgi:hypothetical protein